MRQLADAAPQVTRARSYEPFGEVLQGTGDAGSWYGFTGEWADATGLEYLRARYYDPWRGRFLTKDPKQGSLLLPVTYNQWIYANANPVLLTDPSGYCLDIEGDAICDYPENMRGEPISEPIIWVSSFLPPWLDICVDCENCYDEIPPSVFFQTLRYLEGIDVRPDTVFSYSFLLHNIGEEWQERDGRLRDDVLIALIMMEFSNIEKGHPAYKESKEALSNQYHSPFKGPVSIYPKGCQGDCSSMVEQIIWISDIQLLRDKPADALRGNTWMQNLPEAREIQAEGYERPPNRSWTWGNYEQGSPIDLYLKHERAVDWWNVATDGLPYEAIYPRYHFWVLTVSQDRACTNRPGGSCKGWRPK